MKCRTAGCGYFNSIDGTGWPDYVMVENDGEVLKGTYDVREYFPVNIRALLALADEMDHPIRQAVWNQTSGVRREHIMAEYARRIREALGVTL